MFVGAGHFQNDVCGFGSGVKKKESFFSRGSSEIKIFCCCLEASRQQEQFYLRSNLQCNDQGRESQCFISILTVPAYHKVDVFVQWERGILIIGQSLKPG